MFDRLTTHDEVFSDKLGAALAMERDSLEMVHARQDAAIRSELKMLFNGQILHTKDQIANLEESFDQLGWQSTGAHSPVAESLADEGRSSIARTDESLVDSAILAGALETEYYEIGVYTNLIAAARARGDDIVADLLQENLSFEIAARDEVMACAQRILDEADQLIISSR